MTASFSDGFAARGCGLGRGFGSTSVVEKALAPSRERARSLIMALIDGIHFFKTRKADTLSIIKKHRSQLLKMHDDAVWDCLSETKAESLE